MGVDPKKTLTERGEDSNMKDGIRCELVELHAVHKEKPTKEFVSRERKTMIKKGDEHYQPSLLEHWRSLVAGKLEGALLHERILLGLAHVPRHELRGSPYNDPWLGHRGISDRTSTLASPFGDGV